MRTGGSFPRCTWVRCECGCGYAGEDEVAQWLLEDALIYAVDLQDEHERVEREQAVERERANRHEIASTGARLAQMLEQAAG